MSFDLAVWNAERELSVDEAAAAYSSLCAGRDATGLVAHARVDAFYKKLVRKFPELHVDDDRSPFAAALDRTGAAVVMPISFSRADEVQDFVSRSARAAGLDVYDPQANALRSAHAANAPDLPPAPPPRLKPKDAEKELAQRLVPPMIARGWAVGAKPKGNPLPLFSRAIGDVQVDYAIARWNSSSVMVTVIVRSPRLARWLEPAAAQRTLWQTRPLAPTDTPILNAHLVYLHLDSGGVWKQSVGQHAICHRDCLEAAVVNVPAELDALATPLLESLSTVSALDTFWHDTRAGAAARLTPSRLGWHLVGAALAHEARRPNRAHWYSWHRAQIEEKRQYPGYAAEAEALLPVYDAIVAAF